MNEKDEIVEHFGFVDGIGQPVIDPAEAGKRWYRNQVQLGEVLLGYDNEADPAPKPDGCPFAKRHVPGIRWSAPTLS